MFKSFELSQLDLVSGKNIFSSEVLKKILSEKYSISYFDNILTDAFDGLTAFQISKDQTRFYLILMNPNIRGGTFSNENLAYLHAFLDFLDIDDSSDPLVFGISSAGVRLTQTRVMFNSIWGILPRLFSIRKKRPYFAFAHELCLGAGALFFGQAQLRIVSGEKSLLNLTGPQVISQFFGKDTNFYKYASAEHQIERHLFIQEIYSDLDNSLKRILNIIDFLAGNTLHDISSTAFHGNLNSESGIYSNYNSPRFENIMQQPADRTSELFPFYSYSGLCYLAQKNNMNFGILINPLDHSTNTISVNTIEKYIEAMNLFKALKLPLLAVTDSPGGDPREKNSNQNVIMKTLKLIELMIDYPFPKIGLIAGRCFGGSGLLAFPTVNKSMGLYALTGSKMGAMSDEAIEKLAKQNPKSYAEWKTSQQTHKTDLSDLLNTGNITGLVQSDKVSDFILQFLEKSQT